MPFARFRPLLAALPLVLLVAGCARNDAPSGESVGDGSEALTENANDKIAFDYFLARGLTPVQAAGIVGGPVWAATFVSQSWPYASAPPIQMTQYQVQHGSIDLKNTGNTTWPAGIVKLAPIPRDQASNLAANSWLAPNRVSTISADV